MKQKQIVQLDQNGYFVGLTVADESPLEPEVFLIPFGAVDVDAPSIPEGKLAKWDGVWVFENAPVPEPKPIIEEPKISYSDLRSAEYREQSDPLFFKAQRGEATIEEWLLKVQEIKQRYPKE